MFTKLLIPLDGSFLAERALNTAVALIKGIADHELLLLRIIDDSKVSISQSSAKKIRQKQFNQGQNYLQGVRQSLMDLRLNIRPMVVEGDPASVIIDTAVAEKADLIVMSTHGRSGIARWMFGSVAEKVLQSVPCPILTVRSENIPANVLIPLDGSMIAGQSLRPGLLVAERLEAQVTFLHMLDSLKNIDEGLGQPQSNPKQRKQNRFLHVLNRLARRELTEVISEYKQNNLPHVQYALREGSPANGILDFANNHDIDLIIMTTHGETGSEQWEYGSVTEKVRQKAKCNMLIIRPSFY